MEPIKLGDYYDLDSPMPGVYLLTEYCSGSSRFQDGSCRCVSHPWYSTAPTTLAYALKLAKENRVDLRSALGHAGH